MDERLLEKTLAAIEEDMSREAGQSFVELLSGYLVAASRGQGPVSTPVKPEEVLPRFTEAPPHIGRPLSEVLEMVSRDVMADSLRLAHPMYMGTPIPPVLPATAWTEAIVGGLNQSTRALVMSPTGTVLETQLIRWMAQQVGYGPRAGGTFTSGGTESNVTAMLAARSACMPESWQEGVGADPPVILCGENAHDTVFRAAAELGLGLKRVLAVPLRDFRMNPEVLEQRLRELAAVRKKIMAVVATVGAFGTGAFDDLETIGRICEAHGVWLHVDACHGGSALLSENHRHRLKGIERAHSIAWNLHKMMFVPLSAAVLLVREERDLDRAFVPAKQFPAPEAPRAWDQTRRSFMASRRLDALKVWVALQRYGTGGLGALYDYLCRLAQVLYDSVISRGDFEVLHAPDCNIVSFRYVGDRSASDEALDEINRQMHREFVHMGKGWIATARIRGHYALRATMMNPLTKVEHVHALLDELAQLARQFQSKR